MPSAFIILLILVALTPAICFADGPKTFAAISLLVALILGLISYSMPPRESEHLTRVLRWPIVLVAVPGIWMLAQLAPLPFTAFSHPAWTSAAEALGTPVAGHISVDLGETLIAFLRYLAAAGVFIAAAALAVDRVRAEWLSTGLFVTTSAFATLLAGHSAHLFQFEAATLDALYSGTSLGTIVAAAAVIRSIERSQPRRNTPKMIYSRVDYSLIVSSVLLAFCWLILIISAPISIIFSAGLGTLIILMVFLFRRLLLGPAIGAAIGLAVVATAVAIAVSSINEDPTDPTLRFASSTPPAITALAERMMLDNDYGSGAATYQVLLPIYHFASDNMALALAPTAASAIKIEMGHVALWMFVLLGFILAYHLFFGALRRGRDSFYSSAAAGGVVALIVQSFLNASLLLTSIVILATSVLGIGLAQSMSRSVRKG